MLLVPEPKDEVVKIYKVLLVGKLAGSRISDEPAPPVQDTRSASVGSELTKKDEDEFKEQLEKIKELNDLTD